MSRAHRMPPRVAVAALAAVASMAAAPAVASAAFTPPRVVSGTASLAADYAYAPAFSANGRYVAFTGSQAGVTGVYRKDLQTNALELVAGGDAGAPSISADGQRVAFTTTAPLDPVDDLNTCRDVYVRDMAIPSSTLGAYVLASAGDGATLGLAYADAGGASCAGGADAASRVALSGDGNLVAFTTLSDSDLAATPGDTSTPAQQVAVRNLATRQTTLVSQTQASLGGTPAPVPDGAAFIRTDVLAPGSKSMSTAAISADGSTVAWMGINVPAQAPVIASLFPGGGNPPPGDEAEPLWRRIADGPSAPTRRITGGDDPGACASCGGPLVTSYNSTGDQNAPEFGTYPDESMIDTPFESAADQLTPQLSANGLEVALLSPQPTTAALSGLALNGLAPTANAYLANMTPGLTRTQAMTPLTEWGANDFSPNAVALTAPITSLAISPDGTRVAFTTSRIAFPLSPPTLVTPPLNQVVSDELYQVNLSAGTLSFASTGFDGAPGNALTVAPSYAGDSRTLAFASSAANLVYGAVNGIGTSAIFTTAEASTPQVAGVSTISPPPAAIATKPRWRLGATVRASSNGSVYVDVRTPGAGTLSASASANVPIVVRAAPAKPKKKPKPAKAKTNTTGRAVAASAKRTPSKKTKTKRAKKRAPRTTTRIAGRVVARAKGAPKKAQRITLRLTPAKAYRALAASKDGLDTAITVTFSARGHARLKVALVATFHAAKTKAKAKAKAKATPKKTTATKTAGRT